LRIERRRADVRISETIRDGPEDEAFEFERTGSRCTSIAAPIKANVSGALSFESA